MKKFFFLLVIGLVVTQSCSDGDDVNDIIPPEPVDTLSLGVYVQENQWIYSQMNQHYLWREDLPDSLSCNYLLDAVSFFKSLLSPRDRFSYCERNEYYEPETRADNDIYNRGSVLCDTIFYVNEHKIGYVCYKSFDKESELEPVLKKFFDSQITDMVLDLRYNGGGYISTCQYLCSSIAPQEAYGQLLEYLKYNDIVTKRLMELGRDSVYSYRFKTPTDGGQTFGTQIYGLKMSKLYVIVSPRTASASESTIICLQPYMDVITIGERTTGKGVGMETFSNKNCKYKLVPITFQYYNANNETVPTEGLLPDYYVEGALDVDIETIGMMSEPLLHETIRIIMSDDEN